MYLEKIDSLASLEEEGLAERNRIQINGKDFLFITLKEVSQDLNTQINKKYSIVSQETGKELKGILSGKKDLKYAGKIKTYMHFIEKINHQEIHYFYNEKRESILGGEQGYQYLGKNKNVVKRLSDNKITIKTHTDHLGYLYNDLWYSEEFISNQIVVGSQDNKKIIFQYDKQIGNYKKSNDYESCTGHRIGYSSYIIGHNNKIFGNHANTVLNAYDLDRDKQILWHATLGEGGYDINNIKKFIKDEKELFILTSFEKEGYRIRNSVGKEIQRIGGKISSQPEYLSGGYGYPGCLVLNENNKIYFLNTSSSNYLGGIEKGIFQEEGFDKYKGDIGNFIHLKDKGRDLLISRYMPKDDAGAEEIKNLSRENNGFANIEKRITYDKHTYYQLSTDKDLYIMKQHENTIPSIILKLNKEGLIQGEKYILGKNLKGQNIFFSPLVQEVPSDENHTPPTGEIWKKAISYDKIVDISNRQDGKKVIFSLNIQEKIYDVIDNYSNIMIVLSDEFKQETDIQNKKRRGEEVFKEKKQELQDFLDGKEEPLPF